MPIYEYACTSCGAQMEKIQKMSDDPLVDCPECNEPRLKKLVSAPAFRLKGEGWYETDFKSGQQKNLHDSGSNKKPNTDAKPAIETKSTPESKADTSPKPKASFES